MTDTGDYAGPMDANEVRPLVGEPGPMVAMVRALSSLWGERFSGVRGALEATRLAWAGVYDPLTEEELAEVVARDLRAGERVGDLAKRYAPDLVRLGRLRPDSVEATARRRFQEFLRAFVWGVRIPEADQNGHVRAGRRGGRPILNATSATSATSAPRL